MPIMPILFKIWRWLPLPLWIRWRIMWLIAPKFMAGSVAVIFDEQGRVLLFYHTYRGDYPWGLPGGWLNHAEDSAHAIVRELQEEGGITIQVEKLLLVATSELYPRLDIYYQCRRIAGEFRPSDEISDTRYFEIAGLENIMEPEMYGMFTRALQHVSRDSG